jgi:ABC-2 type transport system ATP-binding protein
LRASAATALLVRTTDDARAAALLGAAPWVSAVGSEDGRLVIETAADQAAAVSRMLAEQEIWITELRPRESNLEEFFLEVTGGEPQDARSRAQGGGRQDA